MTFFYIFHIFLFASFDLQSSLIKRRDSWMNKCGFSLLETPSLSSDRVQLLFLPAFPCALCSCF